MDSMTYLALKSFGINKNRIIGMGGALDSSRFKTYISKSLNYTSKMILMQWLLVVMEIQQ